MDLHRHPIVTYGALLLTAVAFPVPSFAADDDELDELYQSGGACTRTAVAAARACKYEKQRQGWVKRGACNNLTNLSDRAQCEEQSVAAAEKAQDECDEQFDARRAVCQVVGEDPYNPRIDPAMFVNPAEIGKTVQPNPYFPLTRGRTAIYKADGETITDTVTVDTREILGVRCAVVHNSVVDRAGRLIEDTVDWYAQDVLGNVWYFGEVAQNFRGGYLANLDGSWVAGVDGARAGIIMRASPAPGVTYRQEFSLGVAEDMSEITSITGSAKTPAASCDGNCLVTRDYTPVEPGAVTNKFYSRSAGLILEVDEGSGDRKELIELKD